MNVEKGYVEATIPAGIDLKEEILKLKKEKNAVIMAHFYQRDEIQDLADYIGDSLALAQLAQDVDAPVIVLCGVHFMGETAKILSPEKTVIVPDLNAGCSLSDSCPAQEFEAFINEHPGHTVISYANTSAAVKALTDVIVTSGNAKQIVDSFPEDEKLIFGPDRNLGNYINSITGRNMVVWDGYCEVHEKFSIEKIVELKKQYPEAKVLVHPECPKPIRLIADKIGSTKALLDFAVADECQQFQRFKVSLIEKAVNILFEEQLVESGHFQLFEEGSMTVMERINLLADLFHFVVDHLWVSAFSDFRKGDSRTETIVGRFGGKPVGGMAYIDNQIAVFENGVFKILDDARDEILFSFHTDCLTKFQVVLPCKGLANNHIRRRIKAFWTAFDEAAEVREHREEVLLHGNRIHRHILVPQLGDRRLAPAIAHRRLHLGNPRKELVREGVGEPRAVWLSEGVDVLPVGALACDAVLLPYVAADNDHERETNDQPHRFNGGVEFVSA